MARVDSPLVEDERDRVVRDALPGLTMGIAVLQAILAVVHATLGSAAERPFVFVDAGSAALAVSLNFAIRKGALPAHWAHPFAAGLAALAALIVLIHLRVLGDPLQSLMLALVIAGAGSLLLSFRWLALVAAPSLLGWFAVMVALGLPPGTRRIGLALLGSWALSMMILTARLRTLRRLEEFQAQNEARLTADVIEARRLADSMRQSEESHRLLFEQSPIPMWLVEASTLEFLAINDAAVRLYGWSRDDLLGMTLCDIRAPAGGSALLADAAGDVPEDGIPHTRQHRKKDGALLDMEVITHHTAFGGWNARLDVLTDVTERLRSEDALRRSRASFQQLFEEAPIGMAMIGADSSFAKVNRALCEMMGYSKDEMNDVSFERFVHPDDLEVHLTAAQEFFQNERSSFKREARYLQKSGDSIWGSLTVERIEDSNGQMIFVLGMLEDISERRRAVEERERIIDELKVALANVKTLRGLIPICASCKKIRDDKGYWSQVEVYVRDRSDAEFSHGMCPDCMKSFYGK